MSILAFIDNTNTVTLVLNTDPTLVASFTTSAHIVEITELAPDTQVGWTYDGTNFIAPVPTDATPVDVLNEEPSTPITP
jgi:hypothetical protein